MCLWPYVWLGKLAQRILLAFKYMNNCVCFVLKSTTFIHFLHFCRLGFEIPIDSIVIWEQLKVLPKWERFFSVKFQHEAKKRSQKEAEHQIERESDEEAEQMMLEPPGEEPQPPAKVDMGVVRSEVMERLLKSLRPPGEPKVHVQLTTSGLVDQNPACPKQVKWLLDDLLNYQQLESWSNRCVLTVEIELLCILCTKLMKWTYIQDVLFICYPC